MYKVIEEHLDYKHFQSVILLRGFIINRAITVEEVINHVIVFHHYKDYKEGIEYQDKELQDMQWKPKVEILKKVLAEYDLGELIKSKENNETLFDLLQRIIEIRHMMAHHRWSRVWEDGASFKKYKLKSEFAFSEEAIEKYDADCKRAVIMLDKILTKLGYWENLFDQLTIKKE